MLRFDITLINSTMKKYNNFYHVVVRNCLLIGMFLFTIQVSAQYYRSSSVNTPVCDVSNDQSQSVIISDGQGGSIIAWMDQRKGKDFDIYIQRYNALGKALWSSGGEPVCRVYSNESSPVMVSDGSGGAIVAWMDDRKGAGIYAQRINSKGGRVWDTMGMPVNTSGNLKANLGMVSDLQGGAVLVWDEMVKDRNILGERIDGKGNIQWSKGGSLDICSDVADQSNPHVEIYGNGGVIVAWEDLRSGKKAQSDIYAQKITFAGGTEWNTNGNVICEAQNDQVNPEVCMNDSGGAFIIWQDARAGSFDIYVQNVAKNGSDLLVKDGVAVCTASGSQTNPTIAYNGSLGFYAAWKDLRTNNGQHIYAQSMDFGGNVLWNTNGEVVCNTTGNREVPKLITEPDNDNFF